LADMQAGGGAVEAAFLAEELNHVRQGYAKMA
jgi:hypothetical protein